MRLDAEFRLATPEDQHLEAFDNTKLVAMGTCPTWGILRYQMHKRMPFTGRNTALECGKAMHQAFSWVRLCTLWQQLPRIVRNEAFIHHGTRLFTADRIDHIRRDAGYPTEDFMEFVKRGAIAVLDTSGYFDEPRDKRRTLTNMEEAILHYIDRWRFDNYIWVRDAFSPQSDVGIEWPFDMVVRLGEMVFRHTGRIDGIHVKKSGSDDRLSVHENKTASRLNDAWEMSFATSSQVTAYCVAASVYTQDVVRDADVFGLAIPLPRGYDYGGYVKTSVTREDHHITRWVSWLHYTVGLFNQWRDDPYRAPMFTHSCNRYFRPCSLIPFCDADPEEQHRIVEDMITDPWSPLDDSGETSE